MSTVNISFTQELLNDIDEVAREESRSRSELLREAARSYIQRKKKWNQIFQVGIMTAERKKLTELDIETEKAAYRAAKNQDK